MKKITLSGLRWHLYRTPAIHAVKALRRAAIGRDIGLRRAMADALPATPIEQQLSADLNRDGYCFVDPALDAGAVAMLSTAARDKLSEANNGTRAERRNHKDFWSRLLDDDYVDGKLPTDNPFVAFALQAPVISVLAKAYGEMPRLDSVLLTLSRDTGNSLSYSQLWHRDYDDTRVIKLFVYLTDVASLADGPFTFLPGPISDRFGFSLHSHRPDSAVLGRRAVSPDQVRSLLSPRLSAFMVETSRCLHMGSRIAAGHERLLYTATYFTVPRLYPEPSLGFRLSGRETEAALSLLATT